jgi:Bacterial Ig-like domain (group 2)
VVKQTSGNARSAVSGADTIAPAETTAAGNGAELASVAVVPAQAMVAIGSTTQVKAIATFSDGSTKDVTTGFAWTSSDTRTITASSSGLLSGLATGKATITGSYQGHQASVPAVSSIGEVNWSGPIVITEAGTYSGNWQSTDSKTPAVTVATTAPVVIENSHISSAAGLIKTSVAGADLTVRNTVGLAANPAVKGQSNGVFLDASSPSRLDVENNYVENAGGGVLVHGYSGNRDGQQTIVIRANRARNLNGLLSDGNGGYLPGVGSNRSVSNFIQLDKVQAVPGVDVGWNEVINYPGRSLVADNIAVKSSSGTPNQPLEIHDTYIQGAYPYTAAQANYDGGGIKTEGSPDDSAQQAPAFNSIHDNQVVGTVNHGIAFTAGHDNIAANNRVISSGMLADGTKIAAQHVGMANGDVNSPNASLYNNTMHDNLIGWTCWTSSCSQSGYRKDQSFPASPGDYSANTVVAQPITPTMENNEYQIWLNKTASAGIAVGPSF